MKRINTLTVLFVIAVGVFLLTGTANSTIYGLKSQCLGCPGSGRYADPPTHLYSFQENCSYFQDIGSVTLDGNDVDADGLAISRIYGLLAFILSHDYSQSRLVSINTTNAQASAIEAHGFRGRSVGLHSIIMVISGFLITQLASFSESIQRMEMRYPEAL